jgi:hypothetical protein
MPRLTELSRSVAGKVVLVTGAGSAKLSVICATSSGEP